MKSIRKYSHFGKARGIEPAVTKKSCTHHVLRDEPGDRTPTLPVKEIEPRKDEVEDVRGEAHNGNEEVREIVLKKETNEVLTNGVLTNSDDDDLENSNKSQETDLSHLILRHLCCRSLSV